MNKYAVSCIATWLCLAVVYADSTNREHLDRYKRIIAGYEEKDVSELANIKRSPREAEDGEELHERMKRVRKEANTLAHKLEAALSRHKRIDVNADSDPNSLERAKRFRRNQENSAGGLERVKRVRKDIGEDPAELKRVKRVRRYMEPSALSIRHDSSAKRVKRLEDEAEASVKRYKRVRRTAGSPDDEIKRLRRRRGGDVSMSDAEANLMRVKRV